MDNLEALNIAAITWNHLVEGVANGFVIGTCIAWWSTHRPRSRPDWEVWRDWGGDRPVTIGGWSDRHSAENAARGYAAINPGEDWSIVRKGRKIKTWRSSGSPAPLPTSPL